MAGDLLAAVGWAVAVAMAATAVSLVRVLGTRSERVARACHELRGPLTAARLALALGERAGALSAERLRAVDLELGRAALALDDLGAVGRSGRGAGVDAVTWEEFDLGDLVLDSVLAWRAAALVRGVELSVERPADPMLVRGDRLRVAQATGNVIANALEHGKGDVAVRARVSAGMARVEFVDSGGGLPAPVAELAGRARRGRGARGRGLAIATAVVVAHGGRLGAAPSERGARIVLELPLAHSSASSSGAGPGL